jgi:hypothetical protein
MSNQIRKYDRPGNPNWQPGVSGNPNGRGPTNRQKIAERLIADLADTWSTYGAAVLRHLATEDPGKFATIAFGLLPRDVFVSVQQATPAGLTADEYAELRGVLEAIEQAKLGDVPPEELFAGIATYLRSSFAKTIEHAPALVIDQSASMPAPPY